MQSILQVRRKSLANTARKSYKRECVTLALLAAVLLFPQFAFAQGDPVSNMINFVLDKMTGTWATGLAVIALGVLGYLSWFGKIHWMWLVGFVFGCVLIFGGTEFRDMLEGGV